MQFADNNVWSHVIIRCLSMHIIVILDSQHAPDCLFSILLSNDVDVAEIKCRSIGVV